MSRYRDEDELDDEEDRYFSDWEDEEDDFDEREAMRFPIDDDELLDDEEDDELLDDGFMVDG
ncbi:MAG TPA: hypothetical protein PK909_06050, partial [Sphaerochaeta sp.]|nr:hypothetical protein [Sphaerochaeta sp.]